MYNRKLNFKSVMYHKGWLPIKNCYERYCQRPMLGRTMLGLAVGISMTAATFAWPMQSALAITDQLADVVVKVQTIPAGTVGTIDIPVVVESDLGVSLGTVEVNYDSSLLTATECQGNPDEEFQLGLCNEDYGDGVVRFNVVHPNGVSGEHILAVITFNIDSELSKAVEFGIEVSDFIDAEVNLMEVRTVTNGNAESFPVAGDLNAANIFLPLILR